MDIVDKNITLSSCGEDVLRSIKKWKYNYRSDIQKTNINISVLLVSLWYLHWVWD